MDLPELLLPAKGNTSKCRTFLYFGVLAINRLMSSNICKFQYFYISLSDRVKIIPETTINTRERTIKALRQLNRAGTGRLFYLAFFNYFPGIFPGFFHDLEKKLKLGLDR
jgi:hypothetical protein